MSTGNQNTTLADYAAISTGNQNTTLADAAHKRFKKLRVSVKKVRVIIKPIAVLLKVKAKGPRKSMEFSPIHSPVSIHTNTPTTVEEFVMQEWTNYKLHGLSEIEKVMKMDKMYCEDPNSVWSQWIRKTMAKQGIFLAPE